MLLTGKSHGRRLDCHFFAVSDLNCSSETDGLFGLRCVLRFTNMVADGREICTATTYSG